MKTFSLPSGTTGFTDGAGRFVCTGSQMGRPNHLPAGRLTIAPRLRLTRLPFVDGDYDRWGAYWGAPANVWCGHGDNDSAATPDDETITVFVRADSRELAKAAVRSYLPNAKFYQ